MFTNFSLPTYPLTERIQNQLSKFSRIRKFLKIEIEEFSKNRGRQARSNTGTWYRSPQQAGPLELMEMDDDIAAWEASHEAELELEREMYPG